MKGGPKRGGRGGGDEAPPTPPGKEWDPAGLWLMQTGFGAAASAWGAPVINRVPPLAPIFTAAAGSPRFPRGPGRAARSGGRSGKGKAPSGIRVK